MLCHCPKLTPLQSRLLASLSALGLVALIYWSLSNPHFAYAAELAVDGRGELRSGEDHNWHRIHNGPILDELVEEEEEEEEKTTPVDTRATKQAQIEDNNVGTSYEAAPGDLVIWEYPNRLLLSKGVSRGVGLPRDKEREDVRESEHADLRRRREEQLEDRQGLPSTERDIFISANTCRQPVWNGTGTQDIAPPQLTLYVSTKSGKRQLGPGGSEQDVYEFNNGFVNASVRSSGNWYMAVEAPQLPGDNFIGSWSYELAVSVDDYFHAANQNDPFLYLVDTDYDSVLLVTNNLTRTNPSDAVYQQWLNTTAPYIMFAMDSNMTGFIGMENSFCGLQTFANSTNQIQARTNDLEGTDTHVQMGMITRGIDNKPKEQFYITSLNSSKQYRGFLAMDGNSTNAGNGVVGGGGKVWGAGVNFTTKSDGNCQLMFNLTFCSEVAYAVPANPRNPTYSNFTNLQNWYDNYTQTWYDPFTWTLDQVACNTTSDARYSLAKNCTDCAAAYKEWLCAVSIPRCEDFSNPAPYLQIRNVGQPFYNNNTLLPSTFLQQNYQPMPGAPTIQGSNAFEQTYISSFATNRSRNQAIDSTIMPGPYKEVLPCEDLCYSLMQSCPASIGFACPYPGRGLETSYGQRPVTGNEVTCSYLGAVYYQNGVTTMHPGVLKAVVWAGALMGWLVLL